MKMITRLIIETPKYKVWISEVFRGKGFWETTERHEQRLKNGQWITSTF